MDQQDYRFHAGLILRSRELGRNNMAGLRSLAAGEIHEYTEFLNQSREQVIDRLKDHAEALGANAVIGVQFDSSEISYLIELLAYGRQSWSKRRRKEQVRSGSGKKKPVFSLNICMDRMFRLS